MSDIELSRLLLALMEYREKQGISGLAAYLVRAIVDDLDRKAQQRGLEL